VAPFVRIAPIERAALGRACNALVNSIETFGEGSGG
jgi:hypothetical protein